MKFNVAVVNPEVLWWGVKSTNFFHIKSTNFKNRIKSKDSLIFLVPPLILCEVQWVLRENKKYACIRRKKMVDLVQYARNSGIGRKYNIGGFKAPPSFINTFVY